MLKLPRVSFTSTESTFEVRRRKYEEVVIDGEVARILQSNRTGPEVARLYLDPVKYKLHNTETVTEQEGRPLGAQRLLEPPPVSGQRGADISLFSIHHCISQFKSLCRPQAERDKF